MKYRRIVIAGGSGLIGRALVKHFKNSAEEIVVLTRSGEQKYPSHRTVSWDAKTEGDWHEEIDGAQVLINLTGRSIQCRFTEKNRVELYDSRIDSTRALSQAVAKVNVQPEVWFNASGSAYYPPSLKPYDENVICEPRDFLGRLCLDWESEFMKNELIRSRRVILRISPVLDEEEGALQPLKTSAKVGAGGKAGNGNQFFSWIHVSDLARAIEFMIGKSDMSGAINISSPNPLPNKELMKAIRKAVGMPIGLPAPAFLIKLMSPIIGVEASLALDSKNIIPRRLTEAGFGFKYADIASALRDLI